MVRTEPHYRRHAFVSGLERLGYTLRDSVERVGNPTPDDVLIVWNRYGGFEDAAALWERRGGRVIVAENGYIGLDSNGIQYYALALNGHNGSGTWPSGDGSRFEQLRLNVKPWWLSGSHIIVRGQRGIGAPSMASPPGWHVRTAIALRKTGRVVQVQEHTGKPACDPGVSAQLIDSLRDAHVMCIWSSAAGVRALVEGVPVLYDAPHWICEGAAVHGVLDLTRIKRDDTARLAALRRMAWAQFTIAEIATGEPFQRLLEGGWS